jgi:hypothetical protein
MGDSQRTHHWVPYASVYGESIGDWSLMSPRGVSHKCQFGWHELDLCGNTNFAADRPRGDVHGGVPKPCLGLHGRESGSAASSGAGGKSESPSCWLATQPATVLVRIRGYTHEEPCGRPGAATMTGKAFAPILFVLLSSPLDAANNPGADGHLRQLRLSPYGQCLIAQDDSEIAVLAGSGSVAADAGSVSAARGRGSVQPAMHPLESNESATRPEYIPVRTR